VAEEDLLFTGFLYQGDAANTPKGRYPYPYPYALYKKYDPRVALRQGTMMPWLDDHWRQRVDARQAGLKEV